MNSTLALGPVASFRILIATGIFTVSPSGTQIPWGEGQCLDIGADLTRHAWDQIRLLIQHHIEYNSKIPSYSQNKFKFE